MKTTVLVTFFDMDLQEPIHQLEMIAVPRIGETIWFEDKNYLVRDVYWYFSNDSELRQIVISIETIL